MKNRFHGVFSICLMFAALTVGGASVFLSNVILGIIYSLLVFISFLVVIYSYCTKCPHVSEGTCRHVIFGLIAGKFRQKTGKYTIFEIICTLLSLMFMVLPVQFWLIKRPVLLGVFWGLLILAVIEVFFFVCRGCYNKNCFNCPNKDKV